MSRNWTWYAKEAAFLVAFYGLMAAAIVNALL